jgi:hypothetical protein
MQARRLSVAVLAWSVLGLVPAALACPRCYTSELVRRAVMGPGFFSQLLLISLPFLVMAAIAALVHRIGDGFRARNQSTRWRR